MLIQRMYTKAYPTGQSASATLPQAISSSPLIFRSCAAVWFYMSNFQEPNWLDFTYAHDCYRIRLSGMLEYANYKWTNIIILLR